MKGKWVSVLLAMALVVVAFGALPAPRASAAGTTYTWAGGASASWATAASWSPARSTPATTDILVFNGGGSVTATAIPAQTIGQLLVSNNTTVNLQAAAANTLTIAGDAGTDLDVPAGSSLNSTGTSALTILLSTGATGSISGSMTCSGAASKLNAADASAITFNSGAYFTQGASCTGNAFTNAGTANVVVFASGSTFEMVGAGSNPFGLAAPNSKVVFQTGSLYKHSSSNTPSFSGRTYADVEFTVNSSPSGTNAVTMDNLTVTSGTLNFNMTATPGHQIKGNVTVAAGATLNFAPTSAGTVTIVGNLTNNNLVTANTNSTIVLNGVITNNGTIRKTNNVSAAGAQSFGLTGVTMNVTGVTATGDIIVDRKDVDHPNATTDGGTKGTKTGKYWTITGTGFTVDLTLPHAGLATPNVCKYPGGLGGAGWDCAVSSSTGTTVTRNGVTSFSDWAVGSSVNATAITLRALTAAAPLSPLAAAPVIGLVLAGGLAAWRRRKA